MSSRPPYERSEGALAEVVDSAVRRGATALVIAGGLIALAIWASGPDDPPRYTAVAVGDGVVRVNGDSGSLVYCDADGCGLLIRGSGDLDRRQLPKAAGAALPASRPAPQPTPALPAPKAAEPASR
jgi:hypothetical protein